MNAPLHLGHPLIDRQHADLYHCIKALRGLQGRPRRDKKVRQLLETLAGMLSNHFSTEEDVMAGAGVPADVRERHIAEHRLILAGLDELRQNDLAGTPYDLSDVCTKADSWINSHMDEFDQELGAYLRINKQTTAPT